MTPHLEAAPGQIASDVIVCGDPKRAARMAGRFLEQCEKINSIRGMEGYTGLYKDHPVTILSVGMGIPSIGIYVHELFHVYGVKRIIRVGTAGSFHPSITIGDNLLALQASTDSAFAKQYELPGTFSSGASFDLAKKADQLASQRQIPLKAGNVLTSDFFYLDRPDYYAPWKKMNVLGVEMEAAALYMIAARAGKEALALLSISDDLERDLHQQPAEREKLEDLFQLALGVFSLQA